MKQGETIAANRPRGVFIIAGNIKRLVEKIDTPATGLMAFAGAVLQN
jgi:hypothetical protein